MSNPFFQFKRFTVYHDLCAMKVGTDGVLLGAWCEVKKSRHILDIGAGTGLICLMAAQRSDAGIDGVEIAPLACVQARENVLRSPWPDRIRLYNESFQEFSKHTDIKYDLIVSNPPYFEESVLPDEHTRINARHTVSLNYDDIFRCSADILAATGRISLIFPFSMEEQVEKSAMRQGFFPIRKTYVSGTPRSLPKRILEEWGRYESLYESDSLVIEEKRHSYTPEYIDLTRDFYLKM